MTTPAQVDALLDPTIIELARRGDTNAFARIVQRYQTPVYNLAYRMLGDPAEAEDAAQETFLRAYAQFRRYRADRKFASWLLSIAAHYCIDRLRRRKFQWLSLDTENVQESLPTCAPGPEEMAFEHEREAEIQQLLQRLPPASRAIVALKYWNDLSMEEIAQVTGDSVSNVKVKLFRARQAMARELEHQTRCKGTAPHRMEKAVSRVR
jgi:RNA polymerase sigma-70 factor, ECF subfamily